MKAQSKVSAYHVLRGPYPAASHELKRSFTIAAGIVAGLFTMSKAGTLLKGRKGDFKVFQAITDKRAKPFPAKAFESGEAQVKLQNAMVGKDGSYRGHVKTVEAFIQAIRTGGKHAIVDSSETSTEVLMVKPK